MKHHKMKYTGYNLHRLKEDDPYHKDEVRIAKMMDQEMRRNPDFIGRILNTDHYITTEEQEKIALSVFQWLGTPVGKAFINQFYNTNIF